MRVLSTAINAQVEGATEFAAVVAADNASILGLDEGDQVLRGVLQVVHAGRLMAEIFDYLHASLLRDSLFHDDEGLCLGVCQAENKLLVPLPPLLPGQPKVLHLDDAHLDPWVADRLLQLLVRTLHQSIQDLIVGAQRSIAGF